MHQAVNLGLFSSGFDHYQEYGAEEGRQPVGGFTNAYFLSDRAESLAVSDESELILALGSNDFVLGLSGNDYLNGNVGDDEINGNIGNDTVRGGQGDDTIYGGKNDDYLFGDLGNDRVFGDLGNDNGYGGLGYDLLFGNIGDDVLNGNEDDDTVYGGEGNDTLYGGKNNDLIFGETGDDRLFGDMGADTLYGGNGSDHFVLGKGTGGFDESEADWIEDFTQSEDLIGLTDGLTYDELNIFAGTGDYQGHTMIQNRVTEEYLAIMKGVDRNTISADDFLFVESGTQETISPAVTEDDSTVSDPGSETSQDDPNVANDLLDSASTSDNDAMANSGDAIAPDLTPVPQSEPDTTPTTTPVVDETPETTPVVDETPVNQAPTDIVLSNSSITENSVDGTELGTLSTADPDAGDTHTYALIDDAEGRFVLEGDRLKVADSTKLDFETANSHNLTVQVTDAAGNILEKQLAVSLSNVNEDPTLVNPIGNQNASEGTGFNFTIPADTFNDPDGDTLTYSAALADGSALPGWLSFDSNTGTFTGTPSYTDAGNLSLEVMAVDGNGGTVSNIFSLAISGTTNNSGQGIYTDEQLDFADNFWQGAKINFLGGWNWTPKTGTILSNSGNEITFDFPWNGQEQYRPQAENAYCGIA